jgi:hypothetical protein
MAASQQLQADGTREVEEIRVPRDELGVVVEAGWCQTSELLLEYTA